MGYCMHDRTRTALSTSTLIALVAVALVSSLPGLAQEEEPAAEVSATQQLTFDPEEVTIQAGETVQWTYEGGGAHTVTSQDEQGAYEPNGEFDYELTPDSGPVNHTFDEPGTYYYYCKPHVGAEMEGTVIVEEAETDGGGGDGGDGDGGDQEDEQEEDDPFTGEDPGDGDGEEEDTPGPAALLALLGVITLVAVIRRSRD